MADLVYYKKDGKLYKLKYELLVHVSHPKRNVRVINKIQDRPYVKSSAIGKAYFNDEFYFKKVSNKGVEVYDRLGIHPNYPYVVDKWKIDDEYYMIVMTKLVGKEMSPNIIRDIMGKDYYSLVSQTISSLEYIHGLNIILDDRGSFDNSLYNDNDNIFYHIDVDDSIIYPLDRHMKESDFYDIISVVMMLLIILDGSVEEYRGDLEYDEDNFAPIWDSPDLLNEFINIKLEETDDIFFRRAFELMLKKVKVFLK